MVLQGKGERVGGDDMQRVGEGKRDGLGGGGGKMGVQTSLLYSTLSISFPARSTRGRHVTSGDECWDVPFQEVPQNLGRTWGCTRVRPTLDMRASV